jgi:hypothetical protein
VRYSSRGLCGGSTKHIRHRRRGVVSHLNGMTYSLSLADRSGRLHAPSPVKPRGREREVNSNLTRDSRNPTQEPFCSTGERRGASRQIRTNSVSTPAGNRWQDCRRCSHGPPAPRQPCEIFAWCEETQQQQRRVVVGGLRPGKTQCLTCGYDHSGKGGGPRSCCLSWFWRRRWQPGRRMPTAARTS